METVPAASRAGRDRLSDLPDCLLHSVLSSLRSRQVVQTCLLSRRWRNLWRFVPCLDVDQRDFMLDEPEPEGPGPAYDDSDADRHAYNKARKERIDMEINRRRSFEDFADTVLPLNGVCPLDAYRLHVAERGLRNASYRWIRRGLARRPAELRIAYGYTSQNNDSSFSFGFVSGAGALPLTTRLRRLHLSGLALSQEFAEELRSECPVLEDLTLVNCEYGYDFVGRIASLSLKRLDIEGGNTSYNSLRSSLCFLAVPALVSLNLDAIFLPDIEDELQSLAVASITNQNERVREYRSFKSLHNARVLELRNFSTTGLFEEEPEEFCKFHNLRTLILIECDIGDACQVLRYVLQNVPNLERLVLRDCKVSGRYRGETASSCSGTAFHGCRNLKSIQVKHKDDAVPHMLVAVLTQIAKDVARRGKRDSVGWLDWMRRVVSCSHIISLSQRYAAASVVGVESDDSLSDEEHESSVWKHRAGKKHEKDGAVKARRRASHLARR